MRRERLGDGLPTPSAGGMRGRAFKVDETVGDGEDEPSSPSGWFR